MPPRGRRYGPCACSSPAACTPTVQSRRSTLSGDGSPSRRRPRPGRSARWPTPWSAPRRRLGRAAGSACCPISTPTSSWVSPGIACTGHGRRPRAHPAGQARTTGLAGRRRGRRRVASAALRAQNILICTPRTAAARRRDAGQIGGYGTSSLQRPVTERDTTVPLCPMTSRLCSASRRHVTKSASFCPYPCSTAAPPTGNDAGWRLVLRTFAARSTSSVTAAPRTGGRSVFSSQHGGLSRPALSGGSTPSRR
jgi:hypothetical protein